jgi:hypothetical protein
MPLEPDSWQHPGMLTDRLIAFVEPLLRADETIAVAMAGFRPLSRSLALVAVFPAVLLGFAVSTAAGWPSWVGGGLGGGVGAGVAAWLDQRRARADHGKGLSIGLVVTSQRLIVLDLETGLVSATVGGVHLDVERSDIETIETERMQGSGIKRLGAVIVLHDGTVERVIPARTDPFLEALVD